MRRTKYIYIGTTASRPLLTLDDIGYEYYDITLKKPIWWNGENWTDATGAILTKDNIIP